MTAKHATPDAPILTHLVERWSPRSFDAAHTLSEGALLGIFEAARWSPSAGNSQPWRFIIARRGTESFTKIANALAEGNQRWALTASALVANLVVTHNAEGKPMRWAEYDLGQAIGHLTVQAQSEGLYLHQMGGFSAEAISEAFELDESLRVVSVMTIGSLGTPEQLPEDLRERELAPRVRKSLDELIVVND